LPDFSWCNIPKREKYTELPQNVPNVHKLYQICKNKNSAVTSSRGHRIAFRFDKECRFVNFGRFTSFFWDF
jgi:hypothetical protein